MTKKLHLHPPTPRTVHCPPGDAVHPGLQSPAVSHGHSWSAAKLCIVKQGWEADTIRRDTATVGPARGQPASKATHLTLGSSVFSALRGGSALRPSIFSQIPMLFWLHRLGSGLRLPSHPTTPCSWWRFPIVLSRAR